MNINLIDQPLVFYNINVMVKVLLHINMQQLLHNGLWGSQNKKKNSICSTVHLIMTLKYMLLSFCCHITYHVAKLFPIYLYLFNDSFTYPKKQKKKKKKAEPIWITYFATIELNYPLGHSSLFEIDPFHDWDNKNYIIFFFFFENKKNYIFKGVVIVISFNDRLNIVRSKKK